MHDTGKVLVGIIIFLIIFTFPIWYNFASGSAAGAPELEKAQRGPCVEDAKYMRTSHMDVLDEWRDKVVRDGKRIYVGIEGKKHNMSLSNVSDYVHTRGMSKSCLDCHQSKANFCDRCHNYAGVDPYCWSCHTTPEEVK